VVNTDDAEAGVLVLVLVVAVAVRKKWCKTIRLLVQLDFFKGVILGGS
jgi:hypothetical protein